MSMETHIIEMLLKRLQYRIEKQPNKQGLDISLTHYCRDRRVLLMSNGGSFASIYKLCTGDERKAPKHNRKP